MGRRVNIRIGSRKAAPYIFYFTLGGGMVNDMRRSLRLTELLLRQFTVLHGIHEVPIDVPVHVLNLVLAIVLVELGHSPNVALAPAPLDSNGFADDVYVVYVEHRK